MTITREMNYSESVFVFPASDTANTCKLRIFTPGAELPFAGHPTVGHTTVYRTLKLLTEAGLAREVRFGDGKTYYEHHYNHDHHDHLICTECGKIIEFFSAEIEDLQDKMAEQYGFRLTNHSLRMWGICTECQTVEAEIHETASGAQPRIRVRSVVN